MLRILTSTAVVAILAMASSNAQAQLPLGITSVTSAVAPVTQMRRDNPNETLGLSLVTVSTPASRSILSPILGEGSRQLPECRSMVALWDATKERAETMDGELIAGALAGLASAIGGQVLPDSMDLSVQARGDGAFAALQARL